jgi:hypothetical protein
MIEHAHQFATTFVKELTVFRFKNVFNPYTDTCPNYDRVDAPLIRCRNLELVLESAITSRVDSIWVARDLGYRGGRRTGLALTDEIHLNWHSKLSSGLPLLKATQGLKVGERTADLVWRALQVIDRPVFLWNIFPLHPHKPGIPMSNRCHTKSERESFNQLHLQLFKVLQPQKVVAIGRDAHTALADLRINSIYIRHPSYGGQLDFCSGLASVYGVSL